MQQVERFQNRPAEEGAGLGLSIVQEIMAAHGGEFIITSTAGGGATASLRFPEAATGTMSETRAASVETV